MTAGLLDTSVVIDWDDAAVIAALPDEVAISAVTLAELAASPHLATTVEERARRQARLQQVESAFDPLPFDAAAARSFGQLVAAATSSQRSHRRRAVDLMIAAVAHANGLDVYTRNPDDFADATTLIAVVAV